MQVYGVVTVNEGPPAANPEGIKKKKKREHHPLSESRTPCDHYS